jgi:hypothetical protein
MEYVSMRQLVEHGADIRQWLSTEPTLDKKRLCTLMLEEKGYHVRPKTAENYLIRLRRGPITRRRMTVRRKISRKRSRERLWTCPIRDIEIRGVGCHGTIFLGPRISVVL